MFPAKGHANDGMTMLVTRDFRATPADRVVGFDGMLGALATEKSAAMDAATALGREADLVAAEALGGRVLGKVLSADPATTAHALACGSGREAVFTGYGGRSSPPRLARLPCGRPGTTAVAASGPCAATPGTIRSWTGARDPPRPASVP